MRCLQHLSRTLLILVLCLSCLSVALASEEGDGNACVDGNCEVRDTIINTGSSNTKKIAIIGGGIAGSSSAYYVSRLIPNAEITIYEKESQVCGRVQDTVINGRNVEVGGSIYHESNTNVDGFVRQFNLTKLTPFGGATLGDGKEFVFRGSDIPVIGSVVNLVKMFYRYGWTPYNLKNYLDSLMGNWSQLYTDVEPFNTIDEFFDRLGLKDEATSLAPEHLEKYGISREFTREILGSMTRVNYNTDVAIMNAFGVAVSAIGSGDDVYGVKEGNKFICSNLVAASKAKSHYGTKVEYVRRAGDQYTVSTGSGPEGPYDAVIIATPLELADITLDADIDDFVYSARKYQEVHVTFVAGDLDSNYFHALNDSAPSFVLTTEDPSIPFSSIGRSKNITIEDGRAVSKVFSRTALSEETLRKVFLNSTVVFKKTIHAYPILRPPTKFVPVQLAPHLYYVNAMESVASTIETETISAKNIARLLAKSWGFNYTITL